MYGLFRIFSAVLAPLAGGAVVWLQVVERTQGGGLAARAQEKRGHAGRRPLRGGVRWRQRPGVGQHPAAGAGQPAQGDSQLGTRGAVLRQRNAQRDGEDDAEEERLWPGL